MRTILRAANVSYRRGMELIFSGIDLELKPGESVALAGPSGSGKTTFMNLCAGLLELEEGELQRAFHRMAYMFQAPRLLPWKNAGENMALGLKAAGIPASIRRQKCYDLAEAMGLKVEDLNKYPHQLSGGMQNRIALGRALVIDPDLILLDEPFAALDVGLKQEMLGLLQRLRRPAAAMLCITHDLMEAVQLCDRILLLAGRPGELVAEIRLETPRDERTEGLVFARTAELMQNAIVRTVFGLPPLSFGERLQGKPHLQGVRIEVFPARKYTRSEAC